MNDHDAAYIKELFAKHPRATKVLLDANVFNYAVSANEAIGVNLFAFLAECEDVFNWYAIQFEAVELIKSGNYNPGIMAQHILPFKNVGIKKISGVPHINEKTQKLEFWNLNSLQFGDWAQIALAHNFPELSIITNDSKFFKSAHAALGGKIVPFHTFIDEIPYWRDNKDWLKLNKWFHDNIEPLRNNSSWKLEKKK